MEAPATVPVVLTFAKLILPLLIIISVVYFTLLTVQNVKSQHALRESTLHFEQSMNRLRSELAIRGVVKDQFSEWESSVNKEDVAVYLEALIKEQQDRNIRKKKLEHSLCFAMSPKTIIENHHRAWGDTLDDGD